MSVLSYVDHLVYGTPDVAGTVDRLEQTLGVRAAPGGRHPAWGTCNALIALGERQYLEIFGPDPEQPPQPGTRPFSVDLIDAPRLVTWVARATNLGDLVSQAGRAGIQLGAVQNRSRLRPDGVQLSWMMTDMMMPRQDGLVPFFIDWGATPHPAETAPPGCTLMSLRAEHPLPARVRTMLTALDLPLHVGHARRPALVARIDTPRGLVELR